MTVEAEALKGLTSAVAADRLQREGPNELPQQRGRAVWRIALETVREPMFALLLAAAVIYLFLGSLEEALFLLFFACTSVGITIVQEARSEKILESLRDLTSPRALVLRDGERRRIPGREVVRGDIVFLAEGDRVPADGVVRLAEDLAADESLLTGEAVPVRKTARSGNVLTETPPGGEDLPLVFSGTLVSRGHGSAEIFATGARSRIGAIGRSLAGIESATPRLMRETRSIVRVVGVMGLVCFAITVLVFGLFRGTWLQALLAGIALGMSMVPEEFPAVLSVFMVMGAWRLSRANVLTRRAATIETLGAATVLCTDKTGTLTENRMTVAELRTEFDSVRVREEQEWPTAARTLAEASILASAVDAFDPMEKAIHLLGKDWQVLLPFVAGRPAKTYPLRPDLLVVANAWQKQDDSYLIAAKGAPEAVVGLCRLSPQRFAAIERSVKEMARGGMRVLAVAKAMHRGGALPSSQRDLVFEYLGLIGLADPIRASVPGAVRECREAGIRVVMITGDYPDTARAIANQAGLAAEEVITGETLSASSDEQLQAAVARACVFARIMPEDKLRLVRALKANGEVVAMTGDGVNDAPALKAADIGIAMGGRGTDVAREASSIVLLDDDFSSIVHTVRLGRRIYDNLRKAMGYILAIHVLIAGMALLPLLTGLPLILLPMHVAFLEMVIDPVCSIVFEAEGEEADIMRRPPRSPRSRLLKPALIQWALLQGLLGLLAVAAVYLAGYRAAMPAPDLRTLTYTALIGVNFCLVLASRSFDRRITRVLAIRNPVLWIVAGIDLILLAAAIFWPPAKQLFAFGAFHWHDFGFVLAAMFAVLASLELAKMLARRRFSTDLAE